MSWSCAGDVLPVFYLEILTNVGRHNEVLYKDNLSSVQ